MRRTINELTAEEIRALKHTFPHGITDAEIKELGEKANIHGMALRGILGPYKPPAAVEPPHPTEEPIIEAHIEVEIESEAEATDAVEPSPMSPNRPDYKRVLVRAEDLPTKDLPTFWQPPAPADDDLQQITDLVNRIRRIKADLDGAADIQINGTVTVSIVIDLSQII